MPYLTNDGRALLEPDESPGTVQVSSEYLAEKADIRDLFPERIVSPADHETIVKSYNSRKDF